MKVDRRRFMAGCAALAAAQSVPPSFSGAKGTPSEERRAPMHRYLFLDDVHIDRAEGIEVRGHPAKRYAGNPLFVKKFPWENARLQQYGRTILYNPERKLYQMFYIA